MKKGLLLLALISSTQLMAQSGIEMYVNGGTVDMAGQTVQVSPLGPGVIVSDIHIVNNTGTTKNWSIARKRINEQPTWSDYLCWGHESDPFGGTCYSATTMNTTLWTTPASVVVADGEGGVLQSDITPDENAPATVTYRYYVVSGSVYEDSIDVEISFFASAPKLYSNISLSVLPNPASDYININLGSLDQASVKMVDVLGNVVLREQVTAQNKKIDVSGFKNGIYFVIIEAPGMKPVNKKIVVRH